MARDPSPRRGGAGVLTAVLLAAAAFMLFAPNVVSAWLGGLVGEAWVAALAALAALFGGLLGPRLT